MLNKKEGITLISLVITIIVLLILAGITIGTLTGENGIIQKAKEAALETRGASVEEAKQMWELERQLGTGKELSELLDELEDQGLLIDEERTIIEETGEITIGSRTIEFIKPDTASIKIKVNTGDDGQVVLPITDANGENFKVDWGDGKIENYPNTSAETIKNKKEVASIENIKIAGGAPDGITHLYEEKNVEKIVTISGNVKAIDVYNVGNVTKEKILEIVQWGETGLESIYLGECINLTKIASPTENSFKNMTTFGGAFGYCKSLESIPEDLFVNCKNVTDFSATFWGCENLKGTAIPLWERVEGYEKLDFEDSEEWRDTVPDGNNCYAFCGEFENYYQIPKYWCDDHSVAS